MQTPKIHADKSKLKMQKLNKANKKLNPSLNFLMMITMQTIPDKIRLIQ